MMNVHYYYIAKGVVDGAVAHKQAWTRLTDNRSGGEDSIVHAHNYGHECNRECRRYHNCITTNLPGSHSIADACPEKESDNG